MSRILKRANVLSTSGHTYSLRIISVVVEHWALNEKKYSELRLTLNSKTAKTNYWNIPFKECNRDGNIRTYCKAYDSYIDIPLTTIKKFLDSYKIGLFEWKDTETEKV